MNGCSRKRDPEFAERAYRKALQLNPYFSFELVCCRFWANLAGGNHRQNRIAARVNIQVRHLLWFADHVTCTSCQLGGDCMRNVGLSVR